MDSKSQSRFSTPAVTQLRREQDDVMLEQKKSPLQTNKYKLHKKHKLNNDIK